MTKRRRGRVREVWRRIRHKMPPPSQVHRDRRRELQEKEQRREMRFPDE